MVTVTVGWGTLRGLPEFRNSRRDHCRKCKRMAGGRGTSRVRESLLGR